MINGVRAIVPLIIFLFILLKVILKADLLQVLIAPPADSHEHEVQLNDINDFFWNSLASWRKRYVGKGHEKEEKRKEKKKPTLLPPWHYYAQWYAGLACAILGIVVSFSKEGGWKKERWKKMKF